MPQLHFSVDEETAARLAREAADRGMSLSRYVATLVMRQLPDRWPQGYVDRVVGAFADEPLEEPPDLPFDEVELGS